MDTKICSRCSIEKKKSSFVKRSNRKSGIQSYCKSCHNKRRRDNYCTKSKREEDLKKTYGISHSDYLNMLSNQNGGCAICNTDNPSKSKRKKHFCVDHCHDTGKIRGLLCDSCNRGIGLLKDNPDILMNAFKYLKS